MKKYLMIAAAATLFAACSEDVLVEPNGSKDNGTLISFATDYNSNLASRAENSDASLYKGLENYHLNFQTWGYKYVKSLAEDGVTEVAAYEDVFSGTDAQSKISWSGSEWTYSPLRFWDKSAEHYDFFAAAPYNANWAIVTPETGERFQKAYLKFTGAEIDGFSLELREDAPAGQTDDVFNTNDGTGKDLMIATDIQLGPDHYTSEKVHFLFNHILSRLNIGVRVGSSILADPNVIVKLDEVKVYNMPSKGNFDESLADETTTPQLSKGTTARWNTYSTPLTVGFPSAQVPCEEGGKLLNAKYQYVYQGLVIPQVVEYDPNVKLNGLNVSASSVPYINIKYTINGEHYSYFYNLAEVLNAANPIKDDLGRVAFKTTEDGEYVYSDDGYVFYARNDDRVLSVIYHNYVDDWYYCITHGSAMSPLYKGADGKFYTDSACTNVYTPLFAAIVEVDGDGAPTPVRPADLGSSQYSLADMPFNEGWQNNLKITINPTSIQFDADVYEWRTKYDNNYDIE